MAKQFIKIKGAREHNLRNLDLAIARNQLVVITGVSGSGKSSLAYDTLYIEGQRRYAQSLSRSARRLLGSWPKPQVDLIEGLTPTIALEQRATQAHPRSTVATATEIADFLRILYAHLGQPHHPSTGEPLQRQSLPQIIESIMQLPAGSRIILLAPLQTEEGTDITILLKRLQAQGFLRLAVDDSIVEIEKILTDPPNHSSNLRLVIDRLIIKEGIRSRLAEAIELGLNWSHRAIEISWQAPRSDQWQQQFFTTQHYHPPTGFTLPELTPSHFSFNHHLGACPRCQGRGTIDQFDPELMIADPERSLARGAVRTWIQKKTRGQNYIEAQITSLAHAENISLDTPWKKLPATFKKKLFYGTGKKAISLRWKSDNQERQVDKPFEGLIPQAERLYASSTSETVRTRIQRFLHRRPCPECEGRRLKSEILAVTLDNGHQSPLNFAQCTAMTTAQARAWFDSFAREHQGLEEVIEQIQRRLRYLDELGLNYLELDRPLGSLSGGEAQRLRLSAQLGSALSGVTYILDEPSIGLHPRDTQRLLGILRELCNQGNTVIVVEHDAEIMLAADHLIDMGPGAGRHGGTIVAQGTPRALQKDKASLTGAYLSGRKNTAPPGAEPRFPDKSTTWLTVHGASHYHLQNLDARFPLGHLTCVTGVSGSGKSTLVIDTLQRALHRHFHRSGPTPGRHRRLSGHDSLTGLVVLDQSPVGKTPRSTPATYTGVFQPIRQLFARVPLARLRGYGPGRFSCNAPGGRCETCRGTGTIQLDQHFLPDVAIPCRDCGGSRFARETLEVYYKGKSIAEVLALTIEEAIDFFQNIPDIHRILSRVGEVGLGYLQLGQPATTLSGGEAQRLKIARELARRERGHLLYLLDEPTTGLHFADITHLLQLLFTLRDRGHSIILIEHHPDVIALCDWIIDLGPEGGALGGQILAEGTPEDIIQNPASITGKYLPPQKKNVHS